MAREYLGGWAEAQTLTQCTSEKVCHEEELVWFGTLERGFVDGGEDNKKLSDVVFKSYTIRQFTVTPADAPTQ